MVAGSRSTGWDVAPSGERRSPPGLGDRRGSEPGGGTDGRVEAWPLDEELEKLGDHAYALALDQRLSGERARRLLGWTPSAPSVFEELERGSYS